MNLKVIILAAGKGTRMKSDMPKVLHEICGKSLIDYAVDLSNEISDNKPIVVIGYKYNDVKEHLGEKAITVVQEEQLGTGHAVKCAINEIDEKDDVLILFGDSPLLSRESIDTMIKNYDGYDALVLASYMENPFGYGRIVKNNEGRFNRIVEEKDATEKEKKVNLINAGVSIINGKDLISYVNKIKANNNQKEYYLPDILNLMQKDGKKINISLCPIEETMGVNSRVQLEEARKVMQKRILTRLMEDGVTIINPDTTYIDALTTIGCDTIVLPNTHITRSTIGKKCNIGPDTYIIDSEIKSSIDIKYSYIEESKVDENTKIGPYSHLRPNSNIGKNAKVGNFVEFKNANLGDNSKASHLAYVGDADIGKDVNIGCGVIFVNYDGVKKYRSKVEDRAFVGSNSNIIAPVLIKEKAYVASGSTVTNDVEGYSLCVARSRQRVIENWVKKSPRFKKNKGSN